MLIFFLDWTNFFDKGRSGKVAIPKGSGGAKAGQPLTDPNLTVIAGDVTNAADVAKVFDHEPASRSEGAHSTGFPFLNQ